MGVEENAEKPASVSVDGNTVSQHALRDQIELDKHVAKKTAAAGRGLPIRLGRIRPGGTI